MRILLFPSIVLLCCTLSCGKPEEVVGPPPPPPCFCEGCCDTSILKAIWAKPLSDDTTDYLCMVPLPFGDKVLFSQLFFDENKEFLKMRDAYTGELLWEWRDQILPGTAPINPNGTVKIKDNIILSHWRRIYCIDANTGQTKWLTSLTGPNQRGVPRIAAIGEYVYHSHYDSVILNKNTYLVRAHYATGQWDTLFNVYKTDGYEGGFEPPGFGLDANGDTILFFQHRQWNFKMNDGRVDLYAYNLRTRSLIWNIQDQDPSGDSGVQPPLCFGQYMFFFGIETIFCYDIATGLLVWKKKFDYPAQVYSKYALLVDGVLYVNPSNQKLLYALDPPTGNILWQTNINGSGEGEIHHYNGKIYLNSSFRFVCVEAATGKLLWQTYNPVRKANYQEFSIDPVTGILYGHDFYFASAVQLK
ncbi:MAG: PQQ-binding-like beta-propeller repeat protein [Saprospiraceae bacterium]